VNLYLIDRMEIEFPRQYLSVSRMFYNYLNSYFM